MKYLKSYQKHKTWNSYSPINEKLFPGILNFFKNLWAKATEELKKLGDAPTIAKVQDYVETNVMNPADKTYIFKKLLDDFDKKIKVNNEDCLNLVKDILDPQDGALGRVGLQDFYDNIIKAFGKESPTLDVVQYLLENIRNRAIKDYKYAGGPDLKIGTNPKVDDKKIILDMKDTTHLPDYKKVILAVDEKNDESGQKRKQAAMLWVNKTLVPRLDKYLDEVAIKEEDVEKYIQSKGKEVPEAEPEGGYKVGDSVMYKRDNWEKNKAQDVWDKLTDDEKKKPEDGKLKDLIDNESIGIKVIKAVEKDFVRFTDVDWIKKNEEILGKVEGEGAKAEGQEDLVKKLGEIKSKNPQDITKVSKYVDFISDEKNKDKSLEIDKIMSEGEEDA